MSERELRALTALGFDELRAGHGRDRLDPAGDRRARVPRGRAGRGARAAGARRRSRAASTRASGSARARSGVAAQARRRRGASAPALSDTPRGSALIAAITGLRGDALEAEGSPLAQPMAVRVDGEPVALEPDALARRRSRTRRRASSSSSTG